MSKDYLKACRHTNGDRCIVCAEARIEELEIQHGHNLEMIQDKEQANQNCQRRIVDLENELRSFMRGHSNCFADPGCGTCSYCRATVLLEGPQARAAKVSEGG